MKRLIAGSILGGALLLSTALSAFADTSSAAAGFGTLFYNGGTIHTVVPPAAFPNTGTDPFFKVTNGAAGQLEASRALHPEPLTITAAPGRSTSLPSVPE